MKIPKSLQNLIDSLERLPGIGPKTAQRLGYYLLHVPQKELETFAESLSELKKNTILCSICKNTTEKDPCLVCEDKNRNNESILVVEQPLDLLAFEKTGKYKGLYHVLHGKIDPLANIGPDEIFISDLFKRLSNGHRGVVKEVIIATNPTMEGDATALYIAKKIKERHGDINVTRLGMGVPTGADLEYADTNTLTQAIEGRTTL